MAKIHEKIETGHVTRIEEEYICVIINEIEEEICFENEIPKEIEVGMVYTRTTFYTGVVKQIFKPDSDQFKGG